MSPGVLATLPANTDELRARAVIAAQRRNSLAGEKSLLRNRYDEIMRWVNPPFDDYTQRADPRPYEATADRVGQPKIHVDWTSQVPLRWAGLQAGAMPTFRVKPRYIPSPLPPDPSDPNAQAEHDYASKIHAIERADAQDQAAQMEEQTNEWGELADLHRWLLWAMWAKETFGVAIGKSGWDDVEKRPTIELLENPGQCYYAWTSRYGSRKLAWMIVADRMLPEEANFRFDIELPVDTTGMIAPGWAGLELDSGDTDQRPEQSDTLARYVWVEESWELHRVPVYDDDGYVTDSETGVTCDFIIAGRVVQSRTWPWKRLPFHVLENQHIPTYSQGKSSVESVISLNSAYDDMLDRQHTVIEFESGPRYIGINFGLSEDILDIPQPGQILPLREGNDVRQLDTRVDFWPSTVHAAELKEGLYYASGLTPIAWGMSPNAQTSGRAMSAEWRAVEVPLATRLINITPDLIDVFRNWWDFAEAYSSKAARIARGYRRFSLVWEPLDIRDQSERVLSVIQLYTNNLLDPETAMEKTGTEDVPQVMAKIRQYLTDPIWNPLRYQQLLVLKQLALQIEQAQMANDAQRAQMQQQQGGRPSLPGQPPSGGDAAAQGEAAAGGQPQPGQGPVTEGQNQPGQQPGAPAIPLDVGLLSRTPLEGGSGNQIMTSVGAPAGGNVGGGY